jgi:type I restriction enzyme S subunit
LPVVERLRRFALINPPTPQFDQLPDSAAVPFLPLEAIWPGARLNTSRRRPKSEVSTGYTRFVEGDILVPKITPTFQADRTVIATGIEGGVGVATTEVHVVRVNGNADRRYVRYLFSTKPFLTEGEAAMTGVAGQQRVPDELLRNLGVPVTDIRTQRAIAEFLERETAQIDGLVGAKRRMIELLEERFRIGLEEVFAPYEGNLAPLGRFVLSITQGASPEAENRPADDGEWGVLKLSAVKNGRFVPSENKALPGGRPAETLVPAIGDLLVTRSNTPAYVGDVCAVTVDPGKVMLPDLIYRLRLDRRLNSEFAASALLRSRARHHFSATARGTSQSMVKLRGEDVKGAPIPVLALDRQLSLIRQLHQARAKTDAIIGHLGRQIQLLVERRQTLITAAVMGQLEIPGVAAA